ncbi:MAG: ABC transporter permease, partial [Gemmiger sp.]|nr:ABC transporter permease [Gemmiger sp.]
MKTYRKNIRRTFKNTRSRFFAIFSIVALGVGFLAGLLSSTPDIEDSMEKYLDGANFYDAKVVSTLGLTDADVTALREIAGVSGVQPAYSADLLVAAGNNDATVARAHSLPVGPDGSPTGSAVINRLELTEGRWPERPGECVIEAGATMVSAHLACGDTFTVTEDNEDIEDTLAVTEFTVVGKVLNAYYFSYEREPASVGNGSVALVFYIQPQDFAYSAYTELYLTAEDALALPTMSEEYTAAVKTVTDAVEGIADARCQARYDGILADAQAEIDDAWQEYNDGKAEADEKLADAAAEIADGKTAIQDAEQELADGQQEIEDGQQELDENAQKLGDGRTALADALNQLTLGKAQYEENAQKLAEGETQLNEGRLQLEEGQRQYQAGMAQYEENLATVAAGEAALPAARQKLEAGQAAYDAGVMELEASRAQVATGETAYAALQEMNTGEKAYQAGVETIVKAAAAQGITLTAAQAEQTFSDAALAAMLASTPESAMKPEELYRYQQLSALNVAQKKLAGGVTAIIAQQAAQGVTLTEEEARATYSDAALAAMRAKLDAGAAALAAGEETLAQSKATLDAGWAEYNAGATTLADARAQLTAAAAQLAAAKTALDAGWATYNEQGGAL